MVHVHEENGSVQREDKQSYMSKTSMFVFHSCFNYHYMQMTINFLSFFFFFFYFEKLNWVIYLFIYLFLFDYPLSIFSQYLANKLQILKSISLLDVITWISN